MAFDLTPGEYAILEVMSEYEEQEWKDAGKPPLRPSLGECILCGERVWDWTDPAEMHEATLLEDQEMYSEARTGLVHAQCGLDAGWKIS